MGPRRARYPSPAFGEPMLAKTRPHQIHSANSQLDCLDLCRAALRLLVGVPDANKSGGLLGRCAGKSLEEEDEGEPIGGNKPVPTVAEASALCIFIHATNLAKGVPHIAEPNPFATSAKLVNSTGALRRRVGPAGPRSNLLRAAAAGLGPDRGPVQLPDLQFPVEAPPALARRPTSCSCCSSGA